MTEFVHRGTIPQPDHPISETWRRVLARSEREGDCLVWQGVRLRGRHGLVGVKRNGKWRTLYTHRVAWEATYGPVPEGMVVCHRCDNPPCVNPEHLFVGTQRDNLNDMRAKGRHNPDDIWVANRKKTHCKRGHEFTPENTRLRQTAEGVSRVCRACCTLESRLRRARIKVAGSDT